MMGIFLRNNKDEICFVRMRSEPVDIDSFHYVAGSRFMNVNMADGEEETITSEIEKEIHDALIKCDSILVAQMDDEGTLKREYSVPLKVD